MSISYDSTYWSGGDGRYPEGGLRSVDVLSYFVDGQFMGLVLRHADLARASATYLAHNGLEAAIHTNDFEQAVGQIERSADLWLSDKTCKD